MSGGARPGAFLDRDGTIIRDVHYLGDPARVELLPRAADAIARLNAARVPVVVVTNQSGIARGMFDIAAYEAVHARLVALLAEQGARLDDTAMCPHHPEVGGPCDCRKPGTRLFVDAAARHGIDPAASLYVGDKWRDVAPGLALGGRGILIPGPDTPVAEIARAEREAEVAADLWDAVSRVLPVAGVSQGR